MRFLSVTSETFLSLQSIILSKNLISAIRADTFAGLSFLTLLKLDNNVIARLPTNIFKDLTVLTSLDLGYKDLIDLNGDLFADDKF